MKIFLTTLIFYCIAISSSAQCAGDTLMFRDSNICLNSQIPFDLLNLITIKGTDFNKLKLEIVSINTIPYDTNDLNFKLIKTKLNAKKQGVIVVKATYSPNINCSFTAVSSINISASPIFNLKFTDTAFCEKTIQKAECNLLNRSQLTSNLTFEWIGKNTTTDTFLATDSSVQIKVVGYVYKHLSLTVSDGKCQTKLKDSIRIFPIATAIFTMSSFDLYPHLVSIDFSNFSRTTFWDNNAYPIEYKWDFDDPYSTENQSQEESPTHIFKTSTKSEFNIYLITKTNQGCFDSTTRRLFRATSQPFYVPTTFTPDGAGVARNNTYHVDSQFPGVIETNIMSRNGDIVFQSKDRTKGWDGTFNGKICPTGQYYCKIKLTTPQGAVYSYNEVIYLLR